MKAHYRTLNGRLTFEVSGETVKDMFRQVATIQDVFEAVTNCGCCNATDIRFQVRVVDDNEYFSMMCNRCHARFQFGQHKKGGTLFPKRSDKGAALPNGGWKKWQANQEDQA